MGNDGFLLYNSNLGISNSVKGDHLYKYFISTLDDLIDILFDHCGPNGGYAIITTPNSSKTTVEKPMFTMDGKNIISSLNYASPIQRFVKFLIYHIGNRVEAKTGDGTTTAMLIACLFAKNILDQYKGPITGNKATIVKVFEKVAQIITSYISEFEKQDVESCMESCKLSYKEAVKKIAYIQAYTSSHGDEQLSTIVSDVFSRMPKESWPYMYFERSILETDEALQVITHPPGEYSISCTIDTPASLTNYAKGEVVCKDVHIYAFNYNIAGGNYVLLNYIRERVKEHREKNEPVAIICSGIGQRLVEEEFNKPGIMVFNHITHTGQDIDPYQNEIVSLNVATGVFPLYNGGALAGYEDHCLRKLTVSDITYRNNELVIHNLYKTNKDEIYHPWVKAKADESNIVDPVRVFQEYTDQLLTRINTIKKDPDGSVSDLRYFNKLYYKLVFPGYSYLMIGGTLYDNVTYIDVITDAMKAVRSSLTHGFVRGSGWSLYTTTKFALIQHQMTNAVFPPHYKLEEDYLKALHLSAKQVINHLYPNDDNVVLDDDDKYTKESIKQLRDTSVIQPFENDVELLKRVKELILKILCTRRVLAMGGMFDPSRDV
jgi:hypothetical protein